MANKVKSLLGGPGFYAVLALCVLAVGVGGYFLLFGEPAQTEAPIQTEPVESLRTGGGPAGARTGGGDRASGGTGGGDGARRHAGGDHPGG